MISILIVCYGSPPLQECLDSIKTNTVLSHEILVHNNNPPNPNLGFTRGNNILFRKSRGDYIMLLNPDTRVCPGWDGPLVAEFENDHVGIVQPRMIYPDGRTGSTGHQWAFNHGIPVIGDRTLEGERELRSCCFGAAMIRRETIEEVGPFDERFFIYYDDVDYCLRSRKNNWHVRYCPESSVVHHWRLSTPGFGAPRSRYTEIFRNDQKAFLWKHYRGSYFMDRLLKIALRVKVGPPQISQPTVGSVPKEGSAYRAEVWTGPPGDGLTRQPTCNVVFQTSFGALINSEY